MQVTVKHNASKNRYEGFVDGKMVSRSRHESYVRDQLAKLGFSTGEASNDVTEKASEFGINERFAFFSLARFKKLERLDLSNTLLVDLSFVEELKGLTYLDISNTRVHNLAPLSGLNQLEFLSFWIFVGVF